MIRAAAPQSYASRSVARVRAWLAANHSQPRARLASEIGVDAKTLRLATEDDWNPTAGTLDKIEAVIPQDWQPPSRKRKAA